METVFVVNWCGSPCAGNPHATRAEAEEWIKQMHMERKAANQPVYGHYAVVEMTHKKFEEITGWHAIGTAKVPEMTQRESAVLAMKVIDLLKEIDNTLQALKVNGLEQHHADLHKRVDPVWRALDPILANGPECVEELVRVDAAE